MKMPSLLLMSALSTVAGVSAAAQIYSVNALGYLDVLTVTHTNAGSFGIYRLAEQQLSPAE